MNSISEFINGKEYRRIISGETTAELGSIYECTLSAELPPALTLKDGKTFCYIYNSDSDSDPEFTPQAFEPVEPVEEPLKFGDKVTIANMAELTYIATREDGTIITTTLSSTEIPLIGEFSAFAWGKHVSVDKVPKPKTITRVKSKTDVVKALVEQGYEYGEDDCWRTDVYNKYTFVPSMFDTCGEEPSGWGYEAEWLEEVEITEEY